MLPPLICFDAGFTLIRPRWTLGEQLATILRDHGHRATDEDVHAAWEVADAWFWSTYHQDGNTAWTSDAGIEDTWRTYHRLMLERLGFADLEHELMDAILEAQFSVEAWETYPETISILEHLRDPESRPGAGPARIAVISDWGTTLVDVLDHLDLRRYVDVLLISASEGLAKPDPALFRRATDLVGVGPSEAVMIGDSYRADVLGAQAAGMAAILLDRSGTAGPVDVPVAADLVEALALAGADG